MQSFNLSNKSATSVWLKICFTVALFLIVFFNFDSTDIFRQLTRLPLEYAAAAITMVVSLFFLGGWRWFVVARTNSVDIDLLTTIRVTAESHFFNQALPATVGGDIYRTWVLVKLENSPDVSVACVAADRLVGAGSLAAIVCLGQIYFHFQVDDNNFRTIGNLAWVLLISLVLMVPIGSVIVRKQLESRFFGVFRVFQQIELLFKHPGGLVCIFFAGLIGNMIIVMVFYLLAIGLEIEISLKQAVIIFPAVFLLSMIPITIAGWGLREAILVTALGYIGTPPSSAVALGLAVGSVMFLASTPGAVLWLIKKR